MGSGGRLKGLSDKVRQRRSIAIQKNSNPFEGKLSTSKRANFSGGLASKKKKSTQSHQMILKSRQKALLAEYQRLGKRNKFKDRRQMYGDKSSDSSALRRFSVEQRKKVRNAARYTLGETADLDVLTHRGQSLAEIERFEQPAESSDDENENEAELDAKFVGSAHFGGGDLEPANPMPGLGRKASLKAFIAQSAARKQERKLDKDETAEMTDALDVQWRELLQSHVSFSGKGPKGLKRAGRGHNDAYDILISQLQTDGKGNRAAETVRLVREKAQEDQQALEKLERDRVARMSKPAEFGHGIEDVEGNLDVGDWQTDDRLEVSYADGQLRNWDMLVLPSRSKTSGCDNSGLDVSEQPATEMRKGVARSSVFAATSDIAQSALPYVFEIPSSYEQLVGLLSSYDNAKCGLILERLVKRYHPSLAQGNKKKLRQLFMLILRHFDTSAAQMGFENGHSVLTLLSALSTGLFNVAKLVPSHAGKCVLVLLKRYSNRFSKPNRTFPPFSLFALLQLVPILFSVSDYWHPVGSPALLLCSRILSSARCSSVNDVCKGLLLASIMLEYVGQSKKYIPEVVVFLTSALSLAISKEEKPLVANFSEAFPVHKKLLILADVSNSITRPALSDIFTARVSSNSVDSLKLYCVSEAVKLLRRCSDIYSESLCYCEIFDVTHRLAKLLPVSLYPEELRISIRSFCDSVVERSKINVKSPLILAKEKNKPMVFLDPRVEEDFDPERKRHQVGKKAERRKLLRHYKKEFRSAVKALRRDAQVLTGEILREERIRDAARKRKTNELLKSLMGQESDYKKLKRKQSHM